MALLSVGAWILWPDSGSPKASVIAGEPVSAEPLETKSVALTSRTLFMGDTYWGRGINLWSQRSALKEAYPFSGFKDFGREKYDAWIANLECPSVPGVNQSYALEVEKLNFNCPSTYLPEAAKWFTAFSMANNHSANQGGQAGIDATRGALEAQGIQYFGHYDPRILSDICEVVTVGARVQMSDGTTQLGKLPIAMCGYHGLATIPTAEALAVMQRYAKVMPVFSYPHLGVEYTAKPTATQASLYHAMIDNGADAVLGGHPHWVQPAEVYKNKLIVYSLGDFIFDQGPGETQRGAAIDMTMKLAVDTASEPNLTAWLKLGETCQAYHDDCLAQAEARGLTKLPVTFHYDAVAVDLSNKLTKPGTGAVEQLVKARLNWDAVSAEINK
jgi:poly-gamma-glutamate synthesis protein (capsule biosynthesis protein)